MGSRIKRAVALGLIAVGAGAVMAPSQAARWDPKKQQWIIECGNVPAYDSGKSVSGFEAWAGPANDNGNFYGVRSGDPYYVAYVDPLNQRAAVYVWQPWYSDDDIAPGGVLKGPFFVDMSVMVDKRGVQYCNTNYNVPPTNPKPPKPPVTVPPRIPAPARTTPAR